MDVSSGSTFPAFRHHVTIWTRPMVDCPRSYVTSSSRVHSITQYTKQQNHNVSFPYWILSNLWKNLWNVCKIPFQTYVKQALLLVTAAENLKPEFPDIFWWKFPISDCKEIYTTEHGIYGKDHLWTHVNQISILINMAGNRNVPITFGEIIQYRISRKVCNAVYGLYTRR
jgi:hypothetical protein